MNNCCLVGRNLGTSKMKGGLAVTQQGGHITLMNQPLQGAKMGILLLHVVKHEPIIK